MNYLGERLQERKDRVCVFGEPRVLGGKKIEEKKGSILGWIHKWE